MALLAATLFIAALAPHPSSADEPKRKKVLVVGIDGCRFDALTKANTPHLDALIKNGIHSPQCLILGDRYRKNDTISGPGWSTIFCGVWADKHGVNDNSFAGENYGEYPHFFRRAKEVKPDLHTASFVTWTPIHEHIVSAADESKAFESDKSDYAKNDAECAPAAVAELAHHDVDALAVYFGQVDVAGHTYGFHPSVPEYIESIERVDGLLGEVLAAVHARKTYAQEDWLVIVTSDHGGKGKGHGGGHSEPEILNSMLIVSGESARRGTFDDTVYLVDVVPTALAHLGIEIDPEWKLDGRAVGLK
jgi:predicted AlkP superfamily pyrophosphatase or phosphodiesterase